MAKNLARPSCPVCGHVYRWQLVRRGSVLFADGPITTLRTRSHAACTWCIERAAQLGIHTWDDF